MSITPRLSPELKSAYRLFLRATSAAILHHGGSKRNLRTLYRPWFDEAAEVETRLQQESSTETRRELEKWLQKWNVRVDNSLEMLHSSAINQGLSHKLTRNMALIARNYRIHMERGRLQWNPQLSKDSVEYTPRHTATIAKRRKKGFSLDTAFRAIGQVVKLAEGQSNIHLGRIVKKRIRYTNITDVIPDEKST
ncbi:hypothetical protein M422DRAFT_174496 [Sphaerobolus stellatus SS14]|uniref:Uncharacterized protein n=1 Tax=Sphaerobolus stellatus (strain SS14) TaxID=990650 RepID=A0A0C9UA10_SPHS4|nr:hypothetical protein M422DRAFT_174496 [Sphaerobolus stellatus SS14]